MNEASTRRRPCTLCTRAWRAHGAVRRLRHADPLSCGVLAEHLHTRKFAGLFDVSHMGQALIEGGDHAAVAHFLERSARPTS